MIAHTLTCAGPVLSVQRGVTFDLVSCRSCFASTHAPKGQVR